MSNISGIGVAITGTIMPTYIELIKPYADYILALGISLIVSPWLLTLVDFIRDKKSKIQNRKGTNYKEPAVNIKKKLEKVRGHVLLAISKYPGLEDNELAEKLSIGTEVAKVYLEELRKIKFVKVAHIQSSAWEGIPYREEWSTDHLGRKYLIHHKLI